MIEAHPVIDADSHKCENPAVFLDYVPAPFRDRVSFVRDRYGEQRIRVVDRDPRSGRPELQAFRCEHPGRVVSEHALDFYGERLRKRILARAEV